ncbi:RHS repeat-associated core domain-containing protein [Actinosynnema pretiosum]|nr:RHS repeat-associated core domain-containing protein [Actinosynnema pretiosum]
MAGRVDPDGDPDNLPGEMDYGWLGQHQRPHEHAGSLSVVQMGARPYIAVLGRFLSPDPVEGGSANLYAHIFGDPLNSNDLDGLFAWGKFFDGALKVASYGAMIGCVALSAGACVVVSGVVLGAQVIHEASTKGSVDWANFAVNAAITLAGGAAGAIIAGAGLGVVKTGQAIRSGLRVKPVVYKAPQVVKRGPSVTNYKQTPDWYKTFVNFYQNSSIGAMQYATALNWTHYHNGTMRAV